MTMEVVRLSGRAAGVGDFLREAMLSQRFADVALCCPGGQKFLAHRLVLSAASPYLQEVLLAHSKSSSYCAEPMTMIILAEMEGPELAALLGFVYTGSATVPRSRLEAFLRAAEALQIRLPALPASQHDVEDVELGRGYPSSWLWRTCEPKPYGYADRPLEAVVAVGPAEEQPPTLAWPGLDERPPADYPSGEDLTCRESCCEWRLPRRPVANQVTASPWRQILRPHHSPKIQPIVLQSHPEPPEQMVPHVDTYSCCLSPKPGAKKELLASKEVPVYYQVPTRLPPEHYGSRVLGCPATPRAPSVPPGLFPSPPTAQAFVPVMPEQSQSAPLLTSRSKPEISHPVSRLCDTLAAEPQPRGTQLFEQPRRPEAEIKEKTVACALVGPCPLRSDDNNNDAPIGPEGAAMHQQRPRGAAAPPLNAHDDHKCEQCAKTFVTRASLKVHLRTHSGEKPFRCSDCGKQFSQLRNYKYHRSVHEGTREFAATCPECGKYFNDRGYLSSHMKIHRNRKEYACAECGKSFNQRVAYNMHVRIHTGLKPHQCEQCGKAFSRKMLLKQHLRTHSGERPYQCQVCHKAFADRSNMTLHTRLHSGLKPYQCTLCSKAFTKKHHLKTHLNYHTGTKPYSCPNCNLRFSQSSNMRTHYKKCALNHPKGLPDEGAHHKPKPEPGVQPPALTPPNSDQESNIGAPKPS